MLFDSGAQSNSPGSYGDSATMPLPAEFQSAISADLTSKALTFAGPMFQPTKRML